MQMTYGEKILKRKAFIKAEMDRQLAEAESDRIWKAAAVRLDAILEHYRSIPKGQRMHTDNFIFPAAAVYLTLKESADAQKAYDIIEQAAIANCAEMNRRLVKMMKLPGMPSLFIHAWGPVSRKMFGPASGFQNVFYPKKKGEYRMDIIACPYHRYFSELGCPELTKIFCDNDLRTYGNLPGIRFCRTGTLGTGKERCDFLVQKRYRRKQ